MVLVHRSGIFSFSQGSIKKKNNSPSLMPPRLFTVRLILIMAAISAAYMLVSFLLIGFRPEQLFLVILCNVLFFASLATRSFVVAFSVFIVYWIIFDYMKAFPNYRF